jgi:hypothetical protein
VDCRRVRPQGFGPLHVIERDPAVGMLLEVADGERHVLRRDRLPVVPFRAGVQREGENSFFRVIGM